MHEWRTYIGALDRSIDNSVTEESGNSPDPSNIGTQFLGLSWFCKSCSRDTDSICFQVSFQGYWYNEQLWKKAFFSPSEEKGRYTYCLL